MSNPGSESPAAPKSSWTPFVSIVAFDMLLLLWVEIYLPLLDMTWWLKAFFFVLASGFAALAVMVFPSKSSGWKIIGAVIVFLISCGVAAPTVKNQWIKDRRSNAVDNIGPSPIPLSVLIPMEVSATPALPPPAQSPTSSNVASTSGNNSPIIQGNPGANVDITINNGLTRDEMIDLIKQAESNPDLMSQLAIEFPKGYALIGYIDGGSTVWVPHFNSLKLSGDLQSSTILITSTNPLNVRLNIPKMVLDYPQAYITNMELDNETADFFNVRENVAVPSQEGVMIGFNASPLFWLKVIDYSKKIFVIGFK
jgi:hypothetical protein